MKKSSFRASHALRLFAFLLLFTLCRFQMACNAAPFSVGGTVSGLSGALILQNNGADEVSIEADGAFSFPETYANSSPYSVTVLRQPEGQTCSVANGEGQIYLNDITDIEVTCANGPGYTVGGSLSGLSGTLVLQNNGGDDLELSSDGAFVFSSSLASGASYEVTVQSQPEGQLCTVSNGSGSATQDVADVEVVCSSIQYTVGGSLSGLVGTVILQNNGGDDLSLSSDGPFTFSTPVAQGASYSVSVLTQPTGYTCSVADGSGTNVTADVSTVSVSCSVNEYNIGGTVSGLSGEIFIQNNGVGTLAIASDGPYYYTLAYGASYSIALTGSQPTGQACEITGCSQGTLSNGVCSGTVGSGDISDIDVTCSDLPQFAYVSSDNTNELFSCSVDSLNGSLSACAATPGGATWGPFATSFAVVNGTQYVYVADNGDCEVEVCTLNSATGALVACTVADPSPLSGWCPVGITVATVGSSSYAYVSNNVTGNLYQCSINAGDGTFSACATLSPSPLSSWDPFAIAFATVNGTQYAYISDGNNNSVYQCAVSTVNGTLSGCGATPSSGAPSWNTNALAFATVNGSQYAYVASNSGEIYQCSLNSDGSFNACAITPSSGAPSWNPRGLSFATVNGVQYVYVAGINGHVYQCSLNSDGTFTGCAITPSSSEPTWSPRGVTVEYIQ